MLALLTAGKLSMPNTGIGYSAAAGGAPRGLGGLGGMGGGFGGGRMGFGGGMGGMGGMGGGFGGMGGGFGRPMGGFGGGFGGGRMGMGGMGGMGGPIGGIMGLLGGMSGGGRMGGMGGMGGQQQMQEQMMLDQEQMMLNQQQMMMNQQQYPNQMGYNQQYATQMGGRMRGLDQTDNQQYPQQMGPMGPTQTRGIQTPNQIGGGMMGPQYPSQAMGSTQIGFGGTQLLTNGVKRILRHVSFPFTQCPLFNSNIGEVLISPTACPLPPNRQHAYRRGNGRCDQVHAACAGGSETRCLKFLNPKTIIKCTMEMDWTWDW